MKLTLKQEYRLHELSNELSNMLDDERCKHHGGGEPENNSVYNAINAAIGSMQEAIEVNQLLINNI